METGRSLRERRQRRLGARHLVRDQQIRDRPVYLNFTGISGEGTDVGVDSAHGKNLRRLSEIKAKYDPDNFFRLNNNITPAGS